LVSQILSKAQKNNTLSFRMKKNLHIKIVQINTIKILETHNLKITKKITTYCKINN
jgi:hypothetical protein